MANDTKKLIIGGGDFSLVLGSTKPTADTEYDATTAAFGNIKSIAMTTEQNAVEHIGSYKGVNVRDDVFVTMIKAGFKITCDEFDDFAVRAMFFAGAGTDATEGGGKVYTPMAGANSLRGYGRLRIYDGRENTSPRITWKDFECIASMTTPPVFDGENYSSYELDVSILGEVGSVTVASTAAAVIPEPPAGQPDEGEVVMNLNEIFYGRKASPAAKPVNASPLPKKKAADYPVKKKQSNEKGKPHVETKPSGDN